MRAAKEVSDREIETKPACRVAFVWKMNGIFESWVLWHTLGTLPKGQGKTLLGVPQSNTEAAEVRKQAGGEGAWGAPRAETKAD